MNKLALLSTLMLSSGLLLAVACSSDPATPTSSSTSSSGTTSSSSSSGSSTVNGCSSFTDQTAQTDAAALTVDWKQTGAPFGTSMPLCWKVKKTQTVTFVPGGGSFSNHPLKSLNGDTTGSPFTAAGDSTTAGNKTVAFTTAGTFGFVCAFHANMVGAIQVVD